MSRIRGATVLITGGASGIGCLLGRTLLARGAGHLIIWDIQAEPLHRVVDELRAAGHRVDGVRVDLSDRTQVIDAGRALDAAGVAVDILVNNAGIVVGKPFAEHEPVDISRTMDINALAPMLLTRMLLPGMVSRGRGHIVNIASAAAMLSNTSMSVYLASKWAMTGWSDSLRLEMERGATGVKVTTVMPYYTDTGMFAGVRSPVIPILRLDRVADEIAGAIDRDRIFLRLPRLLNLLPLVRGILPVRWFDKVVGDWFGVYRSMSGFTGRS